MIVLFTPLFCQMAKAHHQKTLFQIRKISAGQISKNNAKGFSGGARSSFAGTGGGAWISFHARSGFALHATKEKIAQKGDNFRNFTVLVRMKGLEPSRHCWH